MFGAANFKGQKFSSLKKDCIKKGELFSDPEFPPSHKSLFYSKIDKDIEWKRPSELCKVPKLIVEGVTCDDLNEGELGNAWFVSAASCLAQEPKLWQKVVPNSREQEWSNENQQSSQNQYAGIFHFQFWRYGQWMDVVIDDRLPTKENKLIFCHSNSRNEFWSALLEKAYAKMYGDYESLSTGYTADALVDFTGGVAEKVVLSEINVKSDEGQSNFFNSLAEASENQALITAYISCSADQTGQTGDQGLILGHGYGVTDVRTVKVAKSLQGNLGARALRMVRLRNPWGSSDWTGPWSDESPEWNSCSAQDRDKMGLRFEQEGEFWMTFEDFLRQFTNVDFCHQVNTSFFSLKKTWTEALLYGEWTVGARGSDKDRSGGNRAQRSFLNNPQFVFDIMAAGDTLMISLEQDDTDIARQTGSENREIGFHVMKVEANRRYRVHIPGEMVAESQYIVSRSIFSKVQLTKGRYVIIPSTAEPGKAGKFVLRLYSSSSTNPKALTEEFPRGGGCCRAQPGLVTLVNVVRADGLEKNPKTTTDSLAVINCEGETVKSDWVKNSESPEWNFKTIFYRKKPDLPITVELRNHNTLIDDFLGLATISDLGTDETEEKEYELFGKSKKERELQKPGKLYVEITTSEDLASL